MKPFHIFILLAAIVVISSSMAIAEHHYKGHGGTMPSWNMEEMDVNKDGALSFEEYSQIQLKQLRAGFDMIDANKDGAISEDEWKTLLKVHGVSPK